MAEDELPAGTAVGRVALAVADAAAVAAFYRDVVGLTVLDGEAVGSSGAEGAEAARASAGGAPDVDVVLGAGGDPLVALRERPDLAPRPSDACGLYHAAFRVPSRAALGAALARVEAAGALDGASDHGVSEALYLRDPEGNGVEIYRDRPCGEWPGAPEGEVAMTNAPLDRAGLRAAAAEDGGGGDERDGDAAGGADPAPPGTDVGHVHCEVSSLDAAERFYCGGLGLGMRARWDGALFVAAGDYHHHVGLNVWHGRSAPAAGLGLDEWTVVVPDADAVASVRDRLADAGHEPEEVPDGGGFVVSDPDGIALHVRNA